ncbi:biotin transport system permease protein [Skermanella aerolata]|uniref:energy-coupling factor transporter transmembrane component T family protein n=1 Tax=Skermanella aerolata TaxID=393310 RepID=UPI003D23E523
MLGLYIDRDSPLHALAPGIKMLALALAALALIAVDDWRVLAAVLAAVLGLFAVARLPAREVVAQLRPVLFLALFFFAVHALLVSWQSGLVTVLRFTILVSLAVGITLTTRVSDMVDALESGLRPLRFIGVNPAKISLMISLAIRFVPLLVDLVREIRAAQQARGLERSVTAVAVPLIVKTLRMASVLTDAIEARGYDPD